MRRLPAALASLLLSVLPSAPRAEIATLATAPVARATKRFDLVLLHGLTNKQHWGDGFLAVCGQTWGDGRVFLVFTNRHASDRAATATRDVRGRILVVGGRDLSSAGDESVARQAQHVHEVVSRLRERHGLGSRFSIVAHSMGGLVARRYVADHPGVVADLVTLGTPHLGSPLANEAKWLGFFAHATDAIVDLQPERCAAFNAHHPASGAPLAEGGRIYTIRGGVQQGDSLVALGQLALGWTLLRTVHGLESDGLVPQASALLEGAVHLADFPAVHHHALVRDPAVARLAAEVLR